MNIYITDKNNDYLLLTEEIDKTTIDDYYLKLELINKAMDNLEEYKLKLEEFRRINNPTLIKKLGVHPDMRNFNK